jgi:hypothetical protein
LLPAELLVVTSRSDGRASPRYLTGRDEPWVRIVMDGFDAYVGRTVGQRDAELPADIRNVAREHGVSRRGAEGVAHVLGRRYSTRVDAPRPPSQLRAIVFEEAARDELFDRAETLARASARLGLLGREIEDALFADRPERRRVVAPPAAWTAAEVIEAYNLALVQGLLLRCEHVSVEVREHVRAVVRFAKLTGLLCTCASSPAGTRLEISGPLSILRHTTKYGFALASFFPAVVATTGFRLEARCLLRGEPVAVSIEASDRIARTHKLPKDADSAVERALSRDLRRLGTAWTLVREAEAVRVGSRAFFPDFTLRHADGFSALVEVVGFYTPEYLQSKLESLRAVAGRPLLVCVDETLACDDGEVPGAVLRFKRRVDASALLAAADELRSNRGARGAACRDDGSATTAPRASQRDATAIERRARSAAVLANDTWSPCESSAMRPKSR